LNSIGYVVFVPTPFCLVMIYTELITFRIFIRHLFHS